jgi:MFS family permease
MYPLASTLGNFIAGYMPDAFTTWFHLAGRAEAYRSVLLFSVLSSFIVLIPISLIREPASTAAAGELQKPAPRVSPWKVLLRPLTIKLSLPNLLIGLGAAILVPYFNVFFAERHQMSDSALGLLFSLGSLVMGVACILGPRLVSNLGGKIRMVVLGEAASLVFQLAIGFSPWLWLAAVGFLVRGALMNMVAPLYDAFGLELTHESEHGAVNSVRYMAWNLGWAVGPYLSGVVQARYGFSPLFLCTGILYALGIALTWIFFRPERMTKKMDQGTIEA